MKTLLVATTFPRWPADPGPAPFVFQLAKHLNRMLPVVVLAPHYPGAARQENLEGVEVRRFQYLWPSRLETLADGQGIQNHLRRSWRARLEVLPFLLAEFHRLRRLLQREKFSAVNAHWLVPSGALAAWLKRRFRFRLVLTAHAADLFLLLRLPAGKSLLRWMVKQAEVVFCVSEAIRQGIAGVTGPSSKFRVLPMGTDLSLFTPAPDKAAARAKLGLGEGFQLLFVGKLTEKKGVTFLLQAMTRLPAECHLLIVGEGGLRNALEAEAGRLGLQGRVRFVGALPQAELADYYRAANLVVVPSVRDATGEAEGMPVVILEAAAAGVPVIATEVCSVPESLKEHGVKEVLSGQVDALVEAIQSGLRGELTPATPEALQAFAWPEIARQYARALSGANM